MGKVLDMGRAESDGAYQVWLNRSHLPEQFEQWAGRKAFPSFPDGYGLFAVVHAETLAEAVSLTTNMPSIFSNGFRQWEIKSGIQTLLPGVVARDIEMGDVIVDPRGNAYRVEDGYFREITASRLLPSVTEYRTEQLQSVYKDNGRNGLRGFGDADVRLLLSAKQLELDRLSSKLSGGRATELDVVLKGRIEAELMDVGVEMTARESRAAKPQAQFKQILAGENGQKHGKELTEAAEREAKVDDLIADFHSRIERLKRDGVPDFPPLGGRLPWTEAAEERKLENIVWESMAVSLDNGGPINVPGMIRVEAVERNVDYARLPEEQRNALESLRAEVSRAKDPDHHAAALLEKIAGLEYDASGHDYQEDPTPRSAKEQFKQILEEQRTDYQAAHLRDTGQDYEKFLKEATERALARMEGKEKEGRER